MIYPPTNDLEREELVSLKAEPWMLVMLEHNPSYCSWGNYEDYMSKDGEGWDCPIEYDDISGLFKLDDLNELVNFYFEVTRKGKDCSLCEGHYYNKETLKLYKSWYNFDNANYINLDDGSRYNNNAWQYHLTQDEVDTLWEKGRLKFNFQTKPTAEMVNKWAINNFGHDSINCFLCVEERAKRLGVYGHCQHCEKGVVYQEDKAHLELQLWYLHPRKGCSRGSRIKNVKQEDIPVVFSYLKEAQKRFNSKFDNIPDVGK